MKCQNCNANEATTYVKHTINGKTTEMHLCAKCAEEMGYTGLAGLGFPSTGFSPFDIFGSLFASALPSAAAADTKRCPSCGASFREIAESGRAGCPECYTVFESEFSPTVRRIHGGAKHIGRIPSCASRKAKSERELEKLREELKTAVTNQDYENAAVLRDKIKELEAAGDASRSDSSKDKREGA